MTGGGLGASGGRADYMGPWLMPPRCSGFHRLALQGRSWESAAVMQATDAGGSGGWWHREGEKCLDSGHILKIKPAGLADGLDVGVRGGPPGCLRALRPEQSEHEVGAHLVGP